MGIKKLIVQAQELFQFDKLQKIEKIASTKRFLVKLRTLKETYKNIEKENLGTKDLSERQEDLTIITLQIQNAEYLLKKLSV